jgi:hypothetical protein
MMSYRSKVASVLVLLTTCMGQDKGSIDPKWAFAYIGTVLNEAQVSGSLAYSGFCDSNGRSADFPKLRAPRNKEASPLQTLREVFADDSKMQVTQEPGGKIRMAETGVPRDLLDLTIRHMSFTSRADPLNSPMEALWVILRAAEVKVFMAAKNIGPPLRDVYQVSIPLSRDSPHISGDLENVTVSQALDYVLQTYPGFWTYENCLSENGGRTVFFRFFPLVPPGVVKFP